LLHNGTVLLAGGIDDLYLSAELYDPGSEIWIDAGSPNSPRTDHTATLLHNGMVLLAGGFFTSEGGPLSSAELYDPLAGTWMATGSLGTARYAHTATLLHNGMVLVAGGNALSEPLASAELFSVSAARE
jgi:hypothetical protein